VSRLDTSAKSDEAVYDYGREQVRLTGRPEVTQKRNVFTGEEIVLFLKEERAEILRDVKATVHPEDLKSPPVKTPP